MSHPLFPQRIDNVYRGHIVAPWLLGLLALGKCAMGANCIFNGRVVAGSADGIPLHTFTAAGERTVLYMFAAWGLSQLLFGLLGMLASVRYRALTSFMFALFLVDQVGRKGIGLALPLERAGGSAGSVVNLVLLALSVAGLALSLWPRDRGTAKA